jgi:hypothetical protein
MSERLEWKANCALWRGRMAFAVVKEASGWKLYRYSQRNDGRVHFQSKEKVRSMKDGKAYAENLWKLWAHAPEDRNTVNDCAALGIIPVGVDTDR